MIKEVRRGLIIETCRKFYDKNCVGSKFFLKIKWEDKIFDREGGKPLRGHV